METRKRQQNDTTKFPNPQKRKKLLDQYRDVINLKHYSPRTGDTYILWTREYILFHNKRHPREMGIPEINQFLTHLASEKKVSASTQNQALSAILFLYRHALDIELDETSLAKFRPQRAKTMPTVLSKDEVKRVIDYLTSTNKLIAQVMYGGGLRVMEAMRLRVKDIDFDNHQIIVRDGKGENDRVTMLPDAVIQPMQLHLKHVKIIHEKDLADGYGSVYLTYALERKYKNANKDWIWQYLFPAPDISKDPPLVSSAATTSTNPPCKKPSKKPPALQKSTSMSPLTLFAIVSPLTSFRPATTSARCKNYSATKM